MEKTNLNLKELKKSIMKKYDKFKFHSIEIPIGYLDISVPWDGKDYNELLDIASKLGAELIYYYEAFPADTKKYAKHADDIAILELGLPSFYDGKLRFISFCADWFDPNDNFYTSIPHTDNILIVKGYLRQTKKSSR